MKKSLYSAILILFFVASAQGQSIIGVVEYLKVENRDSFKNIQEKWIKIQESRVELHEISGWSIFEVSSRMTTQPYNYVRITYFGSFLKMEAEISDKAIEKAYPGITDSQWKAMVEEEKASCIVASAGVFYREIGSQKGLDKDAGFFLIQEITVNRGHSKDYLKMQENYYKPVYEELIRKEECTAWSVWAKWTGKTENYQFVTAEGYQSLEKMESENFAQAFNQVHRAANYSTINKSLSAIKETTNSEVWKVIFRILPYQ